MIGGFKLPGFLTSKSAASAREQLPAGPRPQPAPEANVAEASDGSAGTIRTKWLELHYDSIEADGRTMRFATTGSSSKKRLRSLFSKEPITIAWIDTFGEGETLYDIGANVGMYTIYAAVMRNASVYAFEPEALELRRAQQEHLSQRPAQASARLLRRAERRRQERTGCCSAISVSAFPIMTSRRIAGPMDKAVRS